MLFFPKRDEPRTGLNNEGWGFEFVDQWLRFHMFNSFHFFDVIGLQGVVKKAWPEGI